MPKIIILLFGISFAILSNCYGQEAIETPQHFGQFYHNPLVNLSRNGLDSKLEINMDNQQNVGVFRGASISYLGLYFNPQEKAKSKNIYGAYFYNDQEGDFLFRRKAQFSFARHQQLTERWSVSLAISTGVHLFGIKPSSTTGAYSSLSFEGNSSLLLYTNNFQIGVAMNQFSNSKIRPVSQEIVLKRHYYFYSEYTLVKEKFSFIPCGYVKYVNITDPLSLKKSTTMGVSLRGTYGIIMAGASYDTYGMYITSGINNWEIFGKKIRIDFSYFVPSSFQTYVNVNRMELNMKLKF